MKILDSAAQNLENPRQLKLHAYLSSFRQGPLTAWTRDTWSTLGLLRIIGF